MTMGFIFQIDEELSLRLHEPRFADEIYELVEANREHISRWMPFTCDGYNRQSSRDYAAQSLKNFAERKSITLSILLNGQAVGSTGWTDWQQGDSFDGRLNHASADIGYWLAEDYVGRGIMTRAVRAVTTLAIREYGIRRLTIRAEVDNEKSWKVPERLGYKLEGVLRDTLRFDGRVVNHKLYAALAGEWLA